MRKLALVLGIMAVVCFVASAYAQAPVAPVTKPAAAPVETTIKGTVAKVDTVKEEITVKPLIGAEKVIAVAADTKITKAGKAIKLADITVGDAVTVKEVDGKVKSIDVVAVPVAPVLPKAPPVTTK